MQLEAWKISSAGAGFHFGQHGLGQEETARAMPSDGLFAALINRLAASEGAQAVEKFMQPFQSSSPPFALSSTFPFAGEVLFLPVPLRAVHDTAAETGAKEFKRVQYVSAGLFRRLIAGETLKTVSPQAEKKYMDGRLWIAKDEETLLPAAIRSGMRIWNVETRPRVTLGRSGQNSSIYFTGRVTYAPGCGLWLAVYWHTPDAGLQARVQQLFAELGDAGLGAERSTGFGVCRFDPAGRLEMPDAGGKPWVSLSRYLPQPAESAALQWEHAAYRLVNVGGWLDSPVRRGQRRRAVNLLEEGATLGALPNPIPGAVVDVRPSYRTNEDPLGHPVWRSGLALAVGWEGGRS